jgi:hypothetical protein
MKKARTTLIVAVLLTGSLFYTTACSAKKEQPQQPSAVAGKSGVEFGQMMNQLTSSLAEWSSLNQDDKKKAVQAIMDFYKTRQNIAILKSVDFYVQKVDESFNTNPTIRALPLPVVLQILSVMEYDFYNGENKDELAKKILGDKMYEANKERLRLEAEGKNPGMPAVPQQ